MKLLIALLVSLVTLSIAGCGPVYKTTFNYQPPASDMGRMCAAQCLQARTTCESMCTMQNQNCVAQAKQDALNEFEAYKAKQHAKGKPIKKTPADFENTLSCDQACGCGNTFNMCYQTCGGTVTPHRECVAFCDKK